jgi:hypothetical protein
MRAGWCTLPKAAYSKAVRSKRNCTLSGNPCNVYTFTLSVY